MGRRDCEDVKRAAMTMPSTLAAFTGVTGTEVILLVRVSRPVTPTDVPALLRRIPSCTAIVTTGEKATMTLCESFGAVPPAVGEYSQVTVEGRGLRLYRMPSSSRAYPLPLKEKAAVYRRLFEDIGMLPTP